jgi:hypothetical protein
MSMEHAFDVPFVAALALREKQIQQNYRPIIAVHKWFARRPGTLFRALLLSELGERPLAEAFYEANDFPGLQVADPFMGGGTPLIEAKLTEDDGTARDKVTRVQHLGALNTAGRPPDHPKFEVVACIAGRGFGVRREDMKKLFLATHGKVFTLQNMHQLVEATRLREYRSL